MLHLQVLADDDVETFRKVNDSALAVYLDSGIDIAAVNPEALMKSHRGWRP